MTVERLYGKIVDVGKGVAVWWDVDGRGLVWRHPKCRGWFPLRFVPDTASTGHQLLAGGPDDPERLTIGGSLLCPRGCGTHGHIVDGRWRPC